MLSSRTWMLVLVGALAATIVLALIGGFPLGGERMFEERPERFG